MGGVGNVLAYLLAICLFAGTYWGVHGMWRRRCVAAARRAASAMAGRYEKGGWLSGGTIYGRQDRRDVVVDFFTGSTRRSPRTTALTILNTPRRGRLLVRRRLLGGWDGAMLSVQPTGVLHDASRIVELASITVALASELERA